MPSGYTRTQLPISSHVTTLKTHRTKFYRIKKKYSCGKSNSVGEHCLKTVKNVLVLLECLSIIC